MPMQEIDHIVNTLFINFADDSVAAKHHLHLDMLAQLHHDDQQNTLFSSFRSLHSQKPNSCTQRHSVHSCQHLRFLLCVQFHHDLRSLFQRPLQVIREDHHLDHGRSVLRLNIHKTTSHVPNLIEFTLRGFRDCCGRLRHPHFYEQFWKCYRSQCFQREGKLWLD